MNQKQNNLSKPKGGTVSFAKLLQLSSKIQILCTQNHTTQESQPNLIKKKALFDQSFLESQKKAMHIIDNYIKSLFHRAKYDISKYWCKGPNKGPK